MKNLIKTICILFIISLSVSCEADTCGSYNGNTTYKGPNGGCYYYNSNGNKTYVDRSHCC